MPKKRGRKTAGRTAKPKLAGSSSRRINLVLWRLVFFLILFIISLVLNMAISNEMWSKLFGMLALITGFVSVAFLLVLLILWFMRLMKK